MNVATMSFEEKKSYFWSVLLAVSAITLAVFWRASSFAFVWDDASLLAESSRYKVGDIWQMIWSSFAISENYFRPWVVGTFVAELRWFDGSPIPMHWHNVLLRVGSAALVSSLVWQLQKRIFPAKNSNAVFPLVAGLLFSLHPILIEPAAWISGRFDSYVAFWLLVLINVDLYLRSSGARCVSAYSFFLLAAMSKEMAVIFPVLYVLIRLACLPDKYTLREYGVALWSEKVPHVFLALILSGLTYLLMRYEAIGYLQKPFDNTVVSEHFGSALQHLLLVGKTTGTYLLYAIAGGAYAGPAHPQTFPVSIGDGHAWVAFLVTVILFITGLFLIIKKNRYGYVILIFFVSLTPVANIVFWPNSEDIVQDRFMLLPLAMTIPLLVALLSGVREDRKIFVYVFLSVVVLLNGLITASMVSVWRNHLSLWSWAVYRSPQSTYANVNLAVAYQKIGKVDQARHYAEVANEISPLSRPGDYMLAVLLADEGKYEDAVRLVDQHLALQKGMGVLEDFLFVKAMALSKLNRDAESENILQDLLREKETDTQAALFLGMLFNKKGEVAKANACWALALKWMPADEAKKQFSDGKVHLDEMLSAARGERCF